MQRRNQIVKTIAFIIKTRAAFAGNFSKQLRFQHSLTSIVNFSHIGHHFQRVQCPPRITVDQLRNCPARLVRQNDILPAVAARFVVHRLHQNLFDIVSRERFKQVHTGAGKQRRIQFK